MDYTQFIKPELATLIPALYALGSIIKHTQKIPDNYIPMILGIVGLVLSCVYIFSVESFCGVSVFTAVVQGILCAAGAVYGNQLYKQINKEE